jgi:hypothetical protein
MLNSRSFRNRQRREERAAQSKSKTHTEIMRQRGANRSIEARGDVKPYKGGTRISLNENAAYSVYSFNMPGSNGSGEYKITSGNQTIIILDGVLFVNKITKSGVDNIILRTSDYATFSKGDVISFCPNAASMSGILIESSELKTKKSSDPIVNNTGADVYQHTRGARRANQRTSLPQRKVKTDAERESFGKAYLAARGVEDRNPGAATNAAGQPLSRVIEKVNAAAAVVEGENPQPMGDKKE